MRFNLIGSRQCRTRDLFAQEASRPRPQGTAFPERDEKHIESRTRDEVESLYPHRLYMQLKSESDMIQGSRENDVCVILNAFSHDERLCIPSALLHAT